MEEKGDAACAGAEVEDAEWRGLLLRLFRVMLDDSFGEVGAVDFGFWAVVDVSGPIFDS